MRGDLKIMENKELKERFIDERTGIEYVRQGDYYIPNLVLQKQKKIHLNKYGRMRLNYLKEHKHAEYIILWFENKLREHLEEVDTTANNQFHLLMKQFAERENITEELKANNQMEWVSRMNNKNCVDEIILKEYIYC